MLNIYVSQNDKLGEITNSAHTSGDNVDTYPECFVGRIPCSTVNELDTWVKKLLCYEQNPGDGDASYLNGFVMTMADKCQQLIGDFPTMDDNLSFFNPLKMFKEQPSYNAPYPTAPLGKDIISYLNGQPSGWWTWDNHGAIDYFAVMTNGDNLSTVEKITSSNGDNGTLSLTNNLKYGIISSNCCHVADFQYPNSMVNASLFNTQGGAVAFSGNTDLAWMPTCTSKLFRISNILRHYHDDFGLAYDFDQNLKRLCPTEWSYYTGLSTNNYEYYESYLTTNFFGDPEMMYYTQAPPRLQATVAPRHISRDVANMVNVTISNLEANNTAKICLFRPASTTCSEWRDTLTVVSSGSGNTVATFSVAANELTSNDNLIVTVTAFDMLPFTDVIIVSPTCTKSNSVEVIASSPQLPWTGKIYKNHDIRIKKPATLTIKGDVFFVAGTKVIVEPGAKLIIDGGSLNAGCDGLWQGVEVVGNAHLTQYPSTNQGSVQVTNQGSINDALCAISTARLSAIGYYPDSTGGTFSCTQAKFTNNQCCIHVYPYAGPNANIGYSSTVTKCDFLLDHHYIPGQYPQNGKFIWYEQIKGIANNGITISNKMDESDATRRGTGIYCSDAGLTLQDICDGTPYLYPCDHKRRPYFEGLYYAITCTNTGASKFTQIANCDFVDNIRAIYLSAVSSPSVILNHFSIRPGIINSSALYLNACTGYSVQENTFEGHYSGTNTYETGIVINNSGTAPNEIYNNTFTKLQNGILAQNQNRDATGQNGLVIKCNDFTPDLKYDIAVTKNESGTSMGISKFQGINGTQTTDPAGNTFSYTHQNSESDYHNECENVTYIYHAVANGFNVNPVNHTPSPIVSTNATTYGSNTYEKLYSCPSHLDNGGGGISQLKVQQDGTETVISNYTGQLLTLKDGGNTAELKEDIAYSIPPEALALYNSLMSKSPYLSDTVLVEAIEKEDVLPSAMVTDILVANPQSAKSSEVNEALDSRTSLLSDEQREDVDQGVFVLSAFESLQSKLSDALAQRAQVQYAIVNHYLGDTTGTDSLKLYLAAQPDLWAKQLLLMQYIADADTMAAGALIQSINSSGLNLLQQNEWDDLTAYYNLCKYIAANESSIPDSLQQIALTELATRNTMAGAYARNLLVNQGIIEYNEPYIFPDDNLKSGKVISRKQETGISGVDLKVYPNPASEYIIVEYQVNEQINKASLSIIDVLGRVQHSITLNVHKGCEVVPLFNISPGIYTIALNTNGRLVKEAKVIVSQ